MPFTAQELDNISNAMIDFHMARGEVYSQSIQDKPLLERMNNKKKMFPGGKGNITVRVKGVYTTTIQGYTHDDTVGYQNPANIRTAFYPWKEIHSGIQVTLTELKMDGISITDTSNGTGESRHSEREMTALANLLDDKIEDMIEGTARGKNLMFWLDGSQDSKQVPGVRSFVLDTPTTGVIVGGIDQGINTWWRNRANVAINAATPANQATVIVLQREFRQLRRYGGRPNLILAGSDFISAVEEELRSKGNYTLEGWTNTKATDASIADIQFKGIKFQYDPTLDDMGRSKYCYVLDDRHIFPMVMEGEDDKKHNPARPEDKYAIYRAQTWTGGLVCRQRNAQGVYAIL